MENYHELFLGGGSVLLAVLSLQKAGKITIKGNVYAYDLNKQLIQVYRHIQTKKDDLFKWIENYKNEYSKCPDVEKGQQIETKNITEAKTSKESYYYWMRKKFNKLNINQ